MRRRAHNAFTLVELLVVVAVIIVLLNFVLMSTEGVVDAAERVRCQANLHQIHIAAMLFAEDHQKKLVKMRPKANNQYKSFSDFLMPYVYQDDRWVDENNNKRMDAQMYRKRELYRCPTTADMAVSSLKSRAETQLDYGINHYGRGGQAGANDKKFYGSSLGGKVKKDDWPRPCLYHIANHGVIYFSDADAGRSPEDIGGVSRGTMEWPMRQSFQVEAFIRHGEGHNTIALNGAGQWHTGLIPQNEKWFIRRVR